MLIQHELVDATARPGPRFIVRSVSGFAGGGKSPLRTFYVLDRAFCHREVPHWVTGPKRGWHWGYRSEPPAQRHANRLNKRYGPWPV